MKGANSVHPQPSRFSPSHAGRPPTSPSKKSRATSAPPSKPTAMAQLQKLIRRLRKIKLRDPERMAWIRMKSRRLCNSWRFTVLTTALTIYALFGDDFRLCVTHKQTDELFNALTMIACLVFGVEIIAQSLGQEEYFLGFFFMLDFGSTVTLILDLTWVSRELFCAGGEGEEALRTSRAGYGTPSRHLASQQDDPRARAWHGAGVWPVVYTGSRASLRDRASRTLVFLDQVCINQRDTEQKAKGIMSIGAFLKYSEQFLVIWDSTYAGRLLYGAC
eukprot:s3211_g5.t1